ncbi:hypothetical protein ACFQE1_04785 [Halobium palmae]|uniref:Uncharacterized protein n=1 Tax=Halobium palmae TaxID=1776492 RepID=A0ABD5RWX2_9EURY
MTRRYTDTENTGLAAVPDLNGAESTDDYGTERSADRRRETMSETVWSHRLTGGSR